MVGAQLLDVRQPSLHLLMAGCVATSSLAAQVSVDAWLLHQSLVRDVAANGLLLADEAILRGDDDPAALVDDSLRVDTGVGGLRGAARLRLASGLPVLRVGGQVRALRMPAWLHALLRGALAAWVAVLCARALANWRTEPRCPTCGGNLERTVKLGVSEVDAQAIAAYWRDLRSALGPADDTAIGAVADTAGAITGDATGDATADGPPLPAIHIAHQEANAPVQLLEDRCTAQCGVVVGWELRRARGRGLQSRAPGPIASVQRSAIRDPQKSGPA